MPLPYLDESLARYALTLVIAYLANDFLYRLSTISCHGEAKNWAIITY
ncbi:hypothetical protein [[Phormidium] sp. ETS-05]|nr:hypothetical protein [[Phormidium] sp. ETS-05]